MIRQQLKFNHGDKTLLGQIEFVEKNSEEIEGHLRTTNEAIESLNKSKTAIDNFV